MEGTAEGGTLADRLAGRVLDALGLVVIALMLCIVVQVAANAAGLSTLIRFEDALPLLGRAVTINSLMELQWHLLTLIGLLPAALVWVMDRHVRVDFLYAAAPVRARATIELAGHAVFTLPFLWFATPAGWAFAERAFALGERSRDGGLADRFLIKGIIPVALALLLLVVALDALRRCRDLWRGR
ncbi:MAG: TRAP transporter small permease subunit [Rhodobacteraceae bacterium]|nr:TRAP transporter small permease subunit [Paracoccaceae bacterium]